MTEVSGNANVAVDLTTQSNYLDISTTHVHFDWSIDWSKRIFTGSATHKLKAHKDVKHVVFDSSFLEIHAVKLGGKAVEYDLKPPHPVMGSALIVPLHSTVAAGETVEVTVDYNTTPEGTAVGWLEKEQTAGKLYDYLFSQCQPIYARCLAPLQDTPSVKITYSARVKSVLPVLMSAIRVSPPSTEQHGGKVVGSDIVEYVYDQPVAIPSYIIAIASGNLVYRPFDDVPGKKWTTGVWTEPELMEASYWEFHKDTAKYVENAETLITPYEFGVYDILLLPPSFPYGGMENACLTFATPTLLAGDRSLVDVIGHEISHSWFGNNVTTADSGHFWLNEGWTTWLERLLQQQLHGPADRDFSYIIGRKALDEALKTYENNPKYQRLVVGYEFGEDPDDAYSSVPYEKGSNFLLYLERLLGGLDVFLPYAQDYVRTFRGKSIRTEQWKEHLYGYFTKHGGEEKIKILDSVDWNAWFYGEGLVLPVENDYDITLAKDAYALAERWDKSRSESDVTKLDFQPTDLNTFTLNQKIVFLERLSDLTSKSPLPSSHILHLDATYTLDANPNAELGLRWYNLALAPPTSSAAKHYAPTAAQWLVDPLALKGRMKFCRPVFKAVGKVDAELAKKVWKENSRFFHPIAKKLIDKDLGLAK